MTSNPTSDSVPERADDAARSQAMQALKALAVLVGPDDSVGNYWRDTIRDTLILQSKLEPLIRELVDQYTDFENIDQCTEVDYLVYGAKTRKLANQIKDILR